MHRYRKLLCTMLALFFAVQAISLPVGAAEVPEPLSEIQEETIVLEESIEETVVQTRPEVVQEEIVEEVVSEETEVLTEAPVPEELQPAQTIPEEITPTETVPEEAAAEETVPGESEPEETVPQETAPEEIVSDETVSEETFPEDAAFEEESPLTVYDTVPLFFQSDYPDVRYGAGTIAASGCSITSLAMVATYLTGHEYLPDELARYFGGAAENNMARLEYGSETLQLPYEKNWDWHMTLQALRDGKIAIVLVDSNSHFTQSQHFIVLTGLTEDGRILVNDPYAPNYEHWALKDGFQQGFTEGDIVCGFQGAWVYDKSAMPEEPFIYYEEEPEVVDYGPVPLYFQNDYPNTRYAGGTVATSGCSITSLAMVASYMTGHEYLPDELARYFGGRAENHMARLEYGSEVLQLPYEKNWDWHVTLQALRDGKIAIVLVNDKTHFTQSQHFIVLIGMTPDGKILVNDSYESNYAHWALKDGFENGFEPEAILSGFEGAWVYDRSAMPEDPYIYSEPEPVRTESRYTGVELTLAEEDLLAKVVWAEARGEPAEGQQAVAEVVLNRLVSENFADTLDEVVYGQDQFRSVPYLEDAEPSQAQYEAVEAALYGPNILPMDVVYFATWATNDNIWGQIENHIFCYMEEA